MDRRGRPPYPDILTPREWEVLELLREGLSNPEIAARLGFSRAGAKYHVSEILSKLGLASRDEAARWQPARHRPWWSLAGVPIAALSRRMPAALHSIPTAAAAVLFVAALGGLGLIAFLLLNGGGGGNVSPGGPAVAAPLDLPARPEENILYVVDERGGEPRQLAISRSLWNVQWSPDGSELALITSEKGELRLSIMPASGGESRVLRRIEDPTSSIDYLWSTSGAIAFLVEGEGELLTTEGAKTATFKATELIEWSPDGEELLIWNRFTDSVDGEIGVIDASTEEPRALAVTATRWPRIAAWSPDGTEVAYLSQTQELACGSEGRPLSAEVLSVVAVATLESRAVFGPTCAAGIAGYDWSPDGERLAFTAPGVPGSEAELERGAYVLELASGDLLQITSEVIDFDVRWLPDGEHLAVKRANCWQCGGSQWWALVTDGGEQLAEWPGGSPGLGIAAGEARVAVGTVTGELLIRDPDDPAGVTLFTSAPFQFRDVAWSPDGASIAFVRWPGWKSNLFTASLAAGDVEPFVLPWRADGATFSPGLDRVAYLNDSVLIVAPASDPARGIEIARDVREVSARVAWSSDGAWLAFLRVRDFPDGELIVARADGSELRVLLEDVEVGDAKLVYGWRPGGSQLLVSGPSSQLAQPTLFDLETGEQSTFDAPAGAWSPDGSEIAYVSDGEVWVVGANGGDPRSLLTLRRGSGSAAAWSPDGRTIAVLEVAADGILWLVDAEGGDPREVASVLPEPRRFAGEYAPDLRSYISSPTVAWSPNGEVIAFNFLRSDGHGVFLYDVADGTVRPLSLNAGGGYSHLIQGWDLDGSRLAFISVWRGP